MQAELFTLKDRVFATVAELQVALDAWASATPPSRRSPAEVGRRSSGSGSRTAPGRRHDQGRRAICVLGWAASRAAGRLSALSRQLAQ
jgi:hypothetical protein